MTIPYLTGFNMTNYPTIFGNFTPFSYGYKMPSIFNGYSAITPITTTGVSPYMPVMPIYNLNVQNYINAISSSVRAGFGWTKKKVSNIYTKVSNQALKIGHSIINKGKVALNKIEEMGLKFTSQKHRQRWSSLDASLQTRLEKLVAFAKSKGITIYINSSLRTEAEQQSLRRQGRPAAKKGSKHLSGKAVDIRVSGDRNKNLAILGKYWRDNLGGKWGGNFRHPQSEPWHFEVA